MVKYKLFTGEQIMTKQKLVVGELVTIRDYSWALRLGLNGCTNNGCVEPHSRQEFKVLVTDCNMPTYVRFDVQQCADTIVMGESDNIVWLVYSGFVRKCNPVYEVVINGQTIKLSRASYETLKQSLTD